MKEKDTKMLPNLSLPVLNSINLSFLKGALVFILNVLLICPGLFN